MQSTLGNLPEFFVVVFALSQGEVVVAQTSIVGSVFANALLVLGLVIIAGCSASSDGIMRFSARLPKDNAILLMLGSFLIVILGISTAAGDRASHHVEAISIAGAVALLVTYGVWIVDYLRSDTPGEASHATPLLTLPAAIVLLAIAGIGAAFVSDWFITALTPTMDKLGIPKAFAGLVIVAIAGNAVENVAGHRPRPQGRVRPRDLGRQELGRPDHGVPLPGPRARVAALHDAPHLPARAGVHRGDAPDCARALVHHERRRGDDVRGRRADRHLRDPGRRDVLRVIGALEERGHALADADAQRGETVAPAAPAQLVEE